jgi:ribosome-associated protein
LSELDHALDPQGARCYRRAGTPESEWIVADYLDVVIHLFSPANRDYYAIERLWSDAKRLS